MAISTPLLIAKGLPFNTVALFQLDEKKFNCNPRRSSGDEIRTTRSTLYNISIHLFSFRTRLATYGSIVNILEIVKKVLCLIQ